MVERLSQALDLPLRERNHLFVSAGLAPAYPESALESEDLAAFRKVVDRILTSHEPFPAYVIDRHWNIVRANAAAARFLPPETERNVVRLTYGGAWQPLIDNWSEIAWLGVHRLQADAVQFPHDPELRDLVDLASSVAADIPRPSLDRPTRVLCPRFRIGAELVSTISVVAQFSAPLDVTLDELRIELICPADDTAERFFRAADTKPRT